jgi:DNA-binding LytR/AlgR family response regulator|nr:response regulator transcription factor [uncultured Emticicia sp.]
MKKINVVLLEDDSIDRLKIEIMLSNVESEEYEIILIDTFKTLESLLLYIEHQIKEIDVIISDIFINHKPKGIRLLKELSNSDIPVILTTSSHDASIYNEAKSIRKIQYLIKPFHKLTLQASIFLVFEENEKRKLHFEDDTKFLFLKSELNQNERTNLTDIIFVEADGNYSYIHTQKKKYIVKKSLTKLISEDLDKHFFRTHHKFAVNRNYVKLLRSQTVLLTNNVNLPIGISFKQAIKEFASLHSIPH